MGPTRLEKYSTLLSFGWEYKKVAKDPRNRPVFAWVSRYCEYPIPDLNKAYEILKNRMEREEEDGYEERV